MRTEQFTAEIAKQVKQLAIMNDQIFTVTMKTAPGVYTFRGCPNVSIWNIRQVVTGSKNPKKEVLFDFCLRSFEVKEGGNYYADAYSRNLRKLTETGNKTSKGKCGPDTAHERQQYGAYASEEVVKANEAPKAKTKKRK
jgi:hypothetical protein